MGKFDLYKKEITLKTPNGELKLIIRPLGGDMLPNWLEVQEVMKNINEAKDGESEKFITKEFLVNAHSLVFYTLKNSYPDEPEEEISVLAAKNLNELLTEVMQINFGE